MMTDSTLPIIHDKIYGHEKYDYDDITLLLYRGKNENSVEARLNSLVEVWNGNKNSGNHNPGQGRGVGKPGNISVYLDDVVYSLPGAHSISKYITKDGKIVASRRKLHEEIAQEVLKKGKETDNPKIIFTGGGYAAGKSTVIDKSTMVIDPDEIKGKLPEFQTAVKNKDLSAGSFAHEESSAIGKMIFDRAIKMNKTVTMDGSLSGDTAKIVKKLNKAKKTGREVEVNLVTTSVQEALKRSYFRYQETGRLPNIKDTVESHRGVSNNFDSIVKAANTVKLYDNNGSKKKLIAESKNAKLNIIDHKAFTDFTNKREVNETNERDKFNANVRKYAKEYLSTHKGAKLRPVEGA